jgi:hypothetical protein
MSKYLGLGRHGRNYTSLLGARIFIRLSGLHEQIQSVEHAISESVICHRLNVVLALYIGHRPKIARSTELFQVATSLVYSLDGVMIPQQRLPPFLEHKEAVSFLFMPRAMAEVKTYDNIKKRYYYNA